MTEKKNYYFKWRVVYVERQLPYKPSLAKGMIQSITRSKAYRAAWSHALQSVKAVYPSSRLCQDMLPCYHRSESSYRMVYDADDGRTYYLYVDEVTA